MRGHDPRRAAPPPESSPPMTSMPPAGKSRSYVELAFTADSSHVVRTARIIAKHMTALADELAALAPDEDQDGDDG